MTFRLTTLDENKEKLEENQDGQGYQINYPCLADYSVLSLQFVCIYAQKNMLGY